MDEQARKGNYQRRAIKPGFYFPRFRLAGSGRGRSAFISRLEIYEWPSPAQASHKK